MFKQKEMDSVKNCTLDLGNWKCKKHDCELKKIIRKGSKWAKLKTGLYGKKSTSETVWICKESLRLQNWQARSVQLYSV